MIWCDAAENALAAAITEGAVIWCDAAENALAAGWKRKQTRNELHKLGGEELWARRDDVLAARNWAKK